LQQLKDALTTDPRLNVDVTREIDYYSKQSTRLTKLITILGGLVAAIMAIGFARCRAPWNTWRTYGYQSREGGRT
jgi:hypothetical protein